MCIIECNFSFEAKTFYLSAKDGYLEFRFKERRKGFVGYIFASIQCSMWLVDSVEAAIQAEVKEEIAKTFCEGDKATMVHMGGNKAGRFLEVSVMVEGGYKGVIWLPEGRFGRGRQRFAGELWLLLVAHSKLPGTAEHGDPSLARPTYLGYSFFGGCLRGGPSFYFRRRGESNRFQGAFLEASRFVSGVVLPLTGV